MQQLSDDERKMQEYRNQLLINRDLTSIREPDFEWWDAPSNTMEALQEIQDFINCSYNMAFDPFPHLREYFPIFHWKYHLIDDPSAEKIIRSLVDLNFDYAFAVCGKPNSMGIVTASEISGMAPRKICFWIPQDEGDRPMSSCPWPERLLNFGFTFLARKDERFPTPMIEKR